MLTVTLYTPQELNHSSYIQTGLFELAQQGFLKTKVTFSVKKHMGVYTIKNNVCTHNPKQAYPKTSFYTLTDTKTTKKIHFATDLYDAANSFSEDALKHCEYVFKRNYNSKYITKLPAEYQQKIHPLGLTFGVTSMYKKQTLKFYWALMLTNLRIQSKADRSFFSRLLKTYKKQRAHIRFIKTARTINEFAAYAPATNNNILFQTRCFLHENNPDVQTVHTERYHLIKLLQKTFKNQFKGGFIPSKIATQKYSDALTNLKTYPQAYLQLVKQTKIAIYTRGLVYSPAWKMAEYLSQGKIIVAERLTAELPESLQHEKHLLYFSAANEVPNLINEVLNNSEKAMQLAKNARIFFEEQVHPVQNVKRILTFMLLDSKK